MSQTPEITETPEILRLAESGRAEDLRELLRAKCDASLYYFTKVAMGYKDLTESLHLAFCEQIQQDEEYQRAGYLLPRGHFKSTIVTKARPLWKLARNPELRFLILGESDTVAGKNLIDVKWNLLNNDILRWLYPELIPPDVNYTKWTESEILLPRHGTYDEPSITTDGIGAKRTGFHYDEIIFDDPIGEKAAKSEAEMLSARTYLQYTPGLLNDPERSKERWVGTRWKHGVADIYGWLMETDPNIRWYRRSAVEDGKPIFPERFSLETLAEIRRREGDYKFFCQYMNDPIAPEGADFPPDWIKYYTVAEDGMTILPSDGTPPIRLGQLLRMSFYDPSSGGKSAKAENALIVGGEASDRRIFILDTWSRNCDYTAAIEKWHQLNDRFMPYMNHYELVGASRAIEDICRARVLMKVCSACGAGGPEKRPHRRLTPLPISPEGGRTNKEERIRFYAQDAFAKGRVYLRKGMEKLRGQIISFPHGDLVDEFDAAAHLIHLLRPPLSDEEISEEKEEFERVRVAHRPRINTEVDYGGYA